MERLGISADDVAEDVLEVVEEYGDLYRTELARVIAAFYGCEPVSNGRGAVAFRGDRQIVKAARSYYQGIARDITMRCDPPANIPSPARKAWKVCFWIGFIGALAQRMKPAPSAPIRQTGSNQNPSTPPVLKDTVSVLEELAEELADSSVDIRSAVEWITQEAQKAGRWFGTRVSIGEPPKPKERRSLALPQSADHGE